MACLMHVPLAFLFFFCIVYCQSVIDNSDQVNNVTDIKLKDKTPPLDEDAGIAHLLVTEDLSNIARNDSNDVENTTVTSDDLFRRRRKRRKHGRKRRRHGRKRRRHGRNRHKNSRRRHGRQSKRHSSSKHRDRKRSRRHGQSHHGSDFFHHGSDFFHHASHHDDYHGSSHFTTTEALPTSTGKHSYRFGTKSTMALPDSAVTSGPAIMMKSPLVENEYYKMNDVNDIKLKDKTPPLDEDAGIAHLLVTEDLSNIARNDSNDVENTTVTSDDLFRRRRKRRKHGRKRRRHGRKRRRHGRNRHKNSRRRHGRQSKRHSSSKHRDRKRSRRHGQSHHGSDFFHHGSDFFHHASHHDDYHGSSHFTTTEALPTSTGKHSYRFGTKSTMALPDSAVTSGPAIMMKSPLVENEYYKMNDVNAINVNNEIPALEKYVDNTHLIEKRDLSDIAKNDFNDVENTNVESDDLFRHHHSRHHRSNHGRHRHHSSRRRHGHRSHRHSSHRHGRQQRHHHGSRRHRSPPC